MGPRDWQIYQKKEHKMHHHSHTVGWICLVLLQLIVKELN